MTDKRNYTSEEWKETEKEEFAIDPKTVAEIDELMTAMHKRCEAAGVPFVCGFVYGHNPENYEVSSSQVLPIDRTPAELLIIASIFKEGAGVCPGIKAALGVSSPLEQLLAGLGHRDEE